MPVCKKIFLREGMIMDKLLLDIENLLEENTQRKCLDFFGDVPCPMKPAFKESYERMTKDHYRRTGESFFSYIPTSCSEVPQRLERLIDLRHATGVDELPDLCLTYGFEDMANPHFIEKFIKTGCFEPVFPNKDRLFITGEEFDDPYGAANVLSLYTEVIMVDKTKLGDLPVPRKWDDLLNPVYAGSIGLPGVHGYTDGTLMIYLYKKYGEKALEKLEKNIKVALPAVYTVQKAGTQNALTAPISVVSWMFANAHIKTDKVELIWPEDGALTEPIVLLAKKGRSSKLDTLLDFVAGEPAASLYAGNYLPATHPKAQNKLPVNAKFQWVGWDYVYNNDLTKLFERLSDRFDRFVVDPGKA